MSTRSGLFVLLYFVAGLPSTAFGDDVLDDGGIEGSTDSAYSTSAHESPEDWVLTRDAEGIRSYKFQREGSSLLRFKGEGAINAPIELVLSVLLDAERAGEWVSYLSESVVLRWIERPGDYIQFSRFDVPWPVQDRVFVSRVSVKVDPETYSAVLLYGHSDEVAVFEDAILGSADGSRYLLEPIDGGKRTHFTGIGVADPKGSLPKWLVNWVGGSWPHESIQALRRQVRKEDVDVMPMVRRLYSGFQSDTQHPTLSLGAAASR